nr:hypothetical protein [Tanacetum cinerariifolium]
EKLEKKASKKSHKLKRLYKIGSSTRVESSKDAGLGDQEDASKQRRMIEDLDVDEGVALVDETQGRNDQDVFDTSIFDDEEVVAEKEVSIADPVKTAGEVVTTVGVEVSIAIITSQISMDEITLAKALIDIKTSKPKEKGIVMQEQRMIDDLDANNEVALVDETQGRNDQDMFDTSILDDEEVVSEKEVSIADLVPTAGEVVTTTGVEVSTAAITSQISMD